MRTPLLVALVVTLGLAAPSRADKPAPPKSYKTASADGKFVFVMLAPRAKPFEGYSKSGLYKPGSDEPLWTVGWYAPKVAVASDGVHVARFAGHHTYEERLNPDPAKKVIVDKDLTKEALSIFARGKLVKELAVGELVGVTRNWTFMRWQKGSARVLDDKKQLAVTALDGTRTLIDLTTGKVVEKKKAE